MHSTDRRIGTIQRLAWPLKIHKTKTKHAKLLHSFQKDIRLYLYVPSGCPPGACLVYQGSGTVGGRHCGAGASAASCKVATRVPQAHRRLNSKGRCFHLSCTCFQSQLARTRHVLRRPKVAGAPDARGQGRGQCRGQCRGAPAPRAQGRQGPCPAWTRSPGPPPRVHSVAAVLAAPLRGQGHGPLPHQPRVVDPAPPRPRGQGRGAGRARSGAGRGALGPEGPHSSRRLSVGVELEHPLEIPASRLLCSRQKV